MDIITYIVIYLFLFSFFLLSLTFSKCTKLSELYIGIKYRMEKAINQKTDLLWSDFYYNVYNIESMITKSDNNLRESKNVASYNSNNSTTFVIITIGTDGI